MSRNISHRKLFSTTAQTAMVIGERVIYTDHNLCVRYRVRARYCDKHWYMFKYDNRVPDLYKMPLLISYR